VLIIWLTLTLAWIIYSIFIAFWTACACRTMSGKGGEFCNICGYTLKTRSVGIMLFGPAVLFSAFTAIYKIVSLSI